MKHPRPRVTPLIGRISGLAPVLAVLTLGWSSLSANAGAVSNLDAVLQNQYAAQEGVAVKASPAYPDTGLPNVNTASATDLVYAVYQLASDPNQQYHSDPTALTNLITGALGGLEQVSGTDNTPKYLRADLNVIAPRVLNAALLGAGFTSPDDVATVTENLVNLNNQYNLSTGKPNTRVQLTVAGKEAVFAQGLKLIGSDATDANVTHAARSLGQSAFATLSPTTGTQAVMDLLTQIYTGTVVKLAGNATSLVPSFVQGVLAGIPAADDRTAYTLKIAEYSIANPAAAGAVIAGRALDIGAVTNNGTPATQDQLTTLLRSAFNDVKLLKADISAFASVATVAGGDQTNLGLSLFDASKPTGTFGKVLAATVANKATVVSGVLQGLASGGAVDNTKVQDVLNNLKDLGAALKVTDFATFAGIAATGTGDAAGFLAHDLILAQNTVYTSTSVNHANPTPAVDTAYRTAIAQAALRAIATTSPSSGGAVAIETITTANSTGQVFSTDVELTTLAKALAKTVPTNGALVGSTVEGIASQLAGQTLSQLSSYITAVVPFAPAAAVNITQAITSKIVLPGGTSTDFANALAASIPVAYAGNAMAGIAAADPANAGSIADAAARSTALKAYGLTLATAISTAIPEERVVDVAQAIAQLLKPLSSTNYNNPNDPNNAYDQVADVKVPKISSISTLAALVAKVIQTKPLIPTQYRTVELSELAATLVDVAVQKIPASTSDANTAKAMEPTLAAIGSSVIAALSPTLLQNDATLAADKKDALQQIAGAVAQAIAASGLSPGVKHALLDRVPVAGHPGLFSPSLLEATLLAKVPATILTPASGGNPAVTYKTLVSQAFTDVLGALNDPNNPTHIVPGNYTPGATGAYASGNVFEVETPVTTAL